MSAAEADDENDDGEDVEEGEDRGDGDGEAGLVGPDTSREGHGQAHGDEEDDDQRDELAGLLPDEGALAFGFGGVEARFHAEPRAEAADHRTERAR